MRIRALMCLRGGTLHLSGLKLPVEDCLRRAGALDAGQDLALYRTDAEALAALRELCTAYVEPSTPVPAQR
ncbi:hypothetical protein D3C71_2158920 [compost metagenome]